MGNVLHLDASEGEARRQSGADPQGCLKCQRPAGAFDTDRPNAPSQGSRAVAKDKRVKHASGGEPTPANHHELHIGPTTPRQEIPSPPPLVAGTPRFEERLAAAPPAVPTVPPAHKRRPAIKGRRLREIFAELDRDGRLRNLAQPADVRKLVAPRFKEVSARTIDRAYKAYLKDRPAK
jgi:hypothetical protein